ncbi:ATP-NAD kinase-like domain-containing protein [Xylariaceae sp. AK1471]|nr:ATP-NAD kinase-like domain-containing protein [Xylariaceae sp. AK1471]
MPVDSSADKQGDDQDGAKFPSPEEVICILQKQTSGDSAGDVYEILSLKEGQQDGTPSFALCRSSYASSDDDENKTLQSLLDDFLIYGPPVHLKPRPQRRVHVLVSTLSGTGLSMKFYSNVLAPLLETLGLTAAGEPEPGATRQQGSYRLVVTQDAESVKKFAQELGGKGRGDGDGDGSLVNMLNGIASTDNDYIASGHDTESQSLPLIAILPLGTGNALFNSLHKTVQTPAPVSDLVQGLRTLLRGKSVPLPSFKAEFPEGSRTITYSETSDAASTSNSSTKTTPSTPSLEEQTKYVTHLYGVVVASYGFHSQLVWESDTPAYRQHGAKRFQMVAQELLKESHAYRATVHISSSSTTTEGQTIGTKRLGRDRHAYILATLVSNLEKTFCISPSSQPLDGQLRLVHFGPVDGAKTMEIMMAAYDEGKHVNMRWGKTEEEGDRVGYEEISEVRITTHEEDARWRKVCIDGTIVEIPAGGCMVVSKETRQHLKVLVDGSIASDSNVVD